MNSDPLPLDGVLVIALEQAVSAPVASCRLADAGARVIKLERAEGDFARYYDRSAGGQSAYFGWSNRGKESLAVDIKDPHDLNLIKRILAKADVFLQNLSVGAADRAGLGSDSLRQQFPQLITCDISGYGETGPYATMKAYDMLVQAESGLISVSSPAEALGRVGISICDLSTGVNAALAITEALVGRSRSGKGVGIKMSLFDVMADFMSVPLLQHEGKGTNPAYAGLSHPTITPYGGFATKDVATVVISIQNDREWANLASLILGRPDLAKHPDYLGNPNRLSRRPQVDRLVQTAFSELTREELETKLRQARVAFGAVNSLEGLSSHPQLRRWTIETETGPFAVPAHPDANRRLPPSRLRIPSLNEHGEAIRAEFSDEFSR